MKCIDLLAQARIQRLPQLLRVLLISDGNLTEMLQAAFLEPIAVTKLQDEIAEARKDIEELQLSAGSMVVSRRVNLVGGLSRHLYVYAETLLAADRIPPALLSELHNTEKPLGHLLRANDLSGRKDLLSVDWTQDDPRCPTSTACVNRRYVVVHKQEPIALVSEHFECSKFDCCPQLLEEPSRDKTNSPKL